MMVKPMNAGSARFQKIFRRVNVSGPDAEWFPMWLEQYARFLERRDQSELVVDRTLVLEFLRSLRDQDVPAWQRCQAVQAIICFRSEVLKTEHPVLSDLETTLSRLADSERRRPDEFGARAAQMPGRIRDDDPELIRRMRTELRTRHYSLRTESAYIGWVERFMRFCGSEYDDDLHSRTEAGAAGAAGLNVRGGLRTQGVAFGWHVDGPLRL